MKKAAEAPEKKTTASPRELEVVTCIVEGCSNKDVARQFNISEEAVNHPERSCCAAMAQSKDLHFFSPTPFPWPITNQPAFARRVIFASFFIRWKNDRAHTSKPGRNP